MVEHAQTQTHDLVEMLDMWQERIEHLEVMLAQEGEPAQACHSETILRMRMAAEDARELLSKSTSMTPEQWIDARTEILARLKALQREYNTIIADWPQE